MANGLERRLKALEDAERNDSCDVCGWGPHMTFEIHDDPDGQDPGKPESCLACGNPNIIVVTWSDQEDFRRGGGDT